jgi:hypothetical protein
MEAVMTKQELSIIGFIKNKLGTDRKWALRALEVIYNEQTDQEKGEQQTRNQNGVGFSALDSKILSGIYEFYYKNGFVTDKQLQNVVFKKMPKYASQIFSLNRDNEEFMYKMDKMMNSQKGDSANE